jgi:hypothetical protein
VSRAVEGATQFQSKSALRALESGPDLVTKRADQAFRRGIQRHVAKYQRTPDPQQKTGGQSWNQFGLAGIPSSSLAGV